MSKHPVEARRVEPKASNRVEPKASNRVEPKASNRVEPKASNMIVALLGHPVAHSLSPAMHNAAFGVLGLPWSYESFDVQPSRLAEAVRGAHALGMVGLNLTIPHKEAVLDLLVRLTPEAKRIGAVNVLERAEKGWIGHNTDAPGFVQAVRRELGLDLKDCRALILGAGGAARAVGFALAEAGAGSIVFANRTRRRGADLARAVHKFRTDLRVDSASLEPQALTAILRDADLVVNTTPIGLRPEDASPLPPGVLRASLCVVDLIYRPPQTALLREARASGARAINGIGMLLHQGALAFRIWTGKEPPVEVMREALGRALAGE